MKPIKIEFLIEDWDQNHLVYENGYLMDSKSAMYAGDKGDIWLVQVVPTDKPGVVRDISGNVKLRDEHGLTTEDEARAMIEKIYKKLSGMTAWEFCRDILCTNYGSEGTDLDLEGDQ